MLSHPYRRPGSQERPNVRLSPGEGVLGRAASWVRVVLRTAPFREA